MWSTWPSIRASGARRRIKFVKPDGKCDSIERFATEAWAANSIGHPNIVEIFDFGTLPEGDVYIVMEYLDGETLAARLRRELRLQVSLALHVAWQTAMGLHAAHDKGIVHRDLKPDNLFLVPDKNPHGHERREDRRLRHRQAAEPVERLFCAHAHGHGAGHAGLRVA